MFTFTNMIPKQNLSKHDFKTGKPKPEMGRPIGEWSDLLTSIQDTQRALESMGDAFGQLHHTGITTRSGRRVRPTPPPPKSRTEKFFELHTALKVSYITLFVLFILPTLAMLFLFVTGMFSTRTVNPEGVEYYEIYMNALSIIRIVGICISGLTLSIYTLWKSK